MEDGKLDRQREEMADVPSSDLLVEENLLAIFLRSRKLPKSSFNLISTIALMVTMVVYVVLSDRELSSLLQDVIDIANAGFNFSVSILGFLIAGLSIFAAVGDLDVFVNMSRVRHKSGLSYLKYNIFTLVQRQD